ncbi:MAG: hypothetical protein JJT89_01030 [Nitriliruptoraceae bacterium]|nr:hypothetical protein [Nitriliruptoraceae bacterium]
MQMRSRLTTLIAVVLSVGLLAVPAAAQVTDETGNGVIAGEGFTIEQCITAILQVQEDLVGSEFEDIDLSDFDFGALPDDVIERLLRTESAEVVCEGYITSVLPIAQNFVLSDPVAECISVVPYLFFTPIIPFDADTITVRFIDTTGEDRPNSENLGTYDGEDEDGNAVQGVVRYEEVIDTSDFADGDVYTVLWPGMELDENGDPIKWPNWEPEFDGDDIIGWNQVDDGFEWARASELGELGVVAEVNPETDLYFVTYAPPDSGCADPEPVEDPEVEGIQLVRDGGEEAAEVLGRTLARTGIDALWLALAGLLLLGLGTVSVMRTRTARQR